MNFGRLSRPSTPSENEDHPPEGFLHRSQSTARLAAKRRTAPAGLVCRTKRWIAAAAIIVIARTAAP
jgi:hypothetical protein